jgi:5-methylcytosine-specific restriction protein A
MARSIGEKRSPKWPKVEEDFRAAHPQCECCGTRQGLQVHHIKPFHLDPVLELDETNLITLCMSENECHLRVGHGDDFKAYNPNVVQDIQEVHAGKYTLLTVTERAKTNRVYEMPVEISALEIPAPPPSGKIEK